MTKKNLMRKNALRDRRKQRVRGKVFGTAELPRVSIFRSNRFFYAQAINDVDGSTIAAIDGSVLKKNASKEAVKEVAKAFADKLQEKKIESIVFDRNGYLYHGVVASFADALRENGIKF